MAMVMAMVMVVVPPDTACLPSGEMATERTQASCPRKIRQHSPDWMSQKRTDLSLRQTYEFDDGDGNGDGDR